MNVHDDSTLLSLDAAAATLSADEQERAAATLERIIATPPSAGAPHPEPRRRIPTLRRRLVLVPAAAIALLAGWIGMQGDGGGATAYASWTATPTSVAGDELQAVESACREKLEGSSMDMAAAKLVLAERRGEQVVLLYRSENPDLSGSCFARNPRGSTDVDVLSAAVGGSTGPAHKPPRRGFTQGAFSGTDGASITDGAVGADVTGVTIHAGALTVNASVQNGRYAAWWPGPAFEASPARPSGERAPVLDVTYDLTLSDGTVIRDARPAGPS